MATVSVKGLLTQGQIYWLACGRQGKDFVATNITLIYAGAKSLFLFLYIQ